MKCIVIYGSSFGNTQKVAQAIAAELGCQVAGVADIRPSSLGDYDLVIIGTPINGWRPLLPVQEFLAQLKPGELNGVKVTTFDTRVKLFIHGDAMSKVAKALAAAGATIITDPVPFYVSGPQQSPQLLPGELQKATN